MTTPRRSILLPVLVCAMGTAMFVAMDTIMKYLSLRMGVYNAVLWRILVSLPPMLVIYVAQRRPWPTGLVLRLHLARGVAATAAVILYFWALRRVSMAEGIALTLIAPLIALLLAGLFLKERIHRASIVAAVVALVGVIIILVGQPGGLRASDDLLAQGALLLGAAIFAANIVIGRRQSQLSDPFAVAFSFNIVALVLFLPGAPMAAALPPVALVGPLLAAAFLANVSMMLVSWAYARAETQYLLPLEYSSFLWAVLFGWLMFGESVSLATLGGAALIVGGCLWGLRQPAAVAQDEMIGAPH